MKRGGLLVRRIDIFLCLDALLCSIFYNHFIHRIFFIVCWATRYDAAVGSNKMISLYTLCVRRFTDNNGQQDQNSCSYFGCGVSDS